MHLSPYSLQYTEQFVNGLQAQLEQSRLQEAELLSALKEMQDKVLDLEKVSTRVRVSSLSHHMSVCLFSVYWHYVFLCARVEEQLPAWWDERSATPRRAETGQAERAGDAALVQRDAGSGHWTQPALAG